MGNMARTLLGSEPVETKIHLHGSFAETGKGHGTDRAIVGGLLGMKPDDSHIPLPFDEAKERGLKYEIDAVALRDAHPNTAVIELTGADGKQLVMQASSARRRQDGRQQAGRYRCELLPAISILSYAIRTKTARWRR